MAEPVNVDEQPPTLQQPSTSQAPAEAAAAGEATLRHSDDKYAPTLFYGKSSEDGETYVAYTEHYKTDKHLSNDEMLELLPVLLRDAASDFYESLNADQKTSWTAFKDTFLQHFGRSTAQRWKDTNMLWSELRGDLNVDDHVTRVTRLAKRLPDLDESMLCHAIIRGFKPHIRSHVLQADVKTIRVTEMASSTADTEVSSTLDEFGASNQQQLIAFQQLSDRINKLSMTPIDSTIQKDYEPPRHRHSDRKSQNDAESAHENVVRTAQFDPTSRASERITPRKAIENR